MRGIRPSYQDPEEIETTLDLTGSVPARLTSSQTSNGAGFVMSQVWVEPPAPKAGVQSSTSPPSYEPDSIEQLSV